MKPKSAERRIKCLYDWMSNCGQMSHITSAMACDPMFKDFRDWVVKEPVVRSTHYGRMMVQYIAHLCGHDWARDSVLNWPKELLPVQYYIDTHRAIRERLG